MAVVLAPAMLDQCLVQCSSLYLVEGTGSYSPTSTGLSINTGPVFHGTIESAVHVTQRFCVRLVVHLIWLRGYTASTEIPTLSHHVPLFAKNFVDKLLLTDAE